MKKMKKKVFSYVYKVKHAKQNHKNSHTKQSVSK